ncbi:hypothetical protein H9C73_02885 [Marinobacterium sp. AK62]|uniref:Uncharacterized protein n=1 Tax=Marinobacterium alkalitolerans TaxID=1542925 RepID=A0ABS3Z8N7_9GAMM|nr:hypothetical protein [Marinobacterium alkalitolerans]MBP0047670.1 hypothetical protein [Marinobacterium alkalitolerans]
MQISARDVWRSSWRAARVEFAAVEHDVRFGGLSLPVGERLQRCRQDHPMQQLAYALLDRRTVADLMPYEWVTDHQGRFYELKASAVAVPESERIPF